MRLLQYYTILVSVLQVRMVYMCICDGWVSDIIDSMQQILQSLEKFIASPLCVFDFKTIDYPTEFQQHLITNYFEMNNLVKTYAHNDVIRQLHTSERTMQLFIAGLLYQMILEPTSVHFQTYMPSLRTESWMYFSKLMQQLLTDSFLWLKEDCRWGVIPLLSKLYYYRHLETDHLILAVKTMDYLDLSESSLNYNNQMLHFFYNILTESTQKTFTSVLAKTLFFKLLRMMSLLICFEDQAVREYKMRCVAVMQKLFEIEKQRCLVVGNSGMNVIKQVDSEEMLIPLMNQLKQALEQTEARPQSVKSASLRLSCILPMRVQTTLLFIIRQNLTKIELKLQLDWVFQSSSEHTILLVVDILRYILAVPVQDLPIKECIFILEWLFYRVCSNNLLFQVWKDELFYPCFAQPCPFPAAPERAFHFLAYLLDSDIDFGQNLLVFLLRHVHISKKTELLKSMLTRTNELNIINLTGLINHPRLRPRTKQQLLVVLGQKKGHQSKVQPVPSEEAIYYDPFSMAVRKDSEISVDFSEDSHQSQQYANSSQEMEIMQSEEAEAQKMGKVKLEKMFVEDMGEGLVELLQRPTLPIYIEFYKQLITVTKKFRVNGEHEMIETFVSETAKITYLLFQNQFQAHSQLVAKEYNIIFYLLNTVAMEWRSNSFNLQLTKKIIKRIVEYFPTAEMAIWRIFLLHFKRGVVVVSRELKEWLIPKDKAEYAVSLLRELGTLTKDIIENAQYLKLPY